ncbi:hypothetical protein DVH05_019056 [Phytophthora capsici]|nr:hypothetical protein DVH05_019056 [Phytophthora capsici]
MTIWSGMMDEDIFSSTAADEWSDPVDGFVARKADFPDVACIFDGTLIRARRPSDFQGFYDKSGKLSYNCLAAIDYRYKSCTSGSLVAAILISPCGTSLLSLVLGLETFARLG